MSKISLSIFIGILFTCFFVSDYMVMTRCNLEPIFIDLNLSKLIKRLDIENLESDSLRCNFSFLRNSLFFSCLVTASLIMINFLTIKFIRALSDIHRHKERNDCNSILTHEKEDNTEDLNDNIYVLESDPDYRFKPIETYFPKAE